MPGQRLSHPEQSASRKVTALSDFDYRVWEQTKLSSDDFGIMPYTSTVLRADNLRLRKATEKQVFDALRRLVDLGLLIVFEHQGEAYVCAPQWQKWQQIRFPRKTSRPHPPADVLAKCEPQTVELFTRWPGGKRFKESAVVADVSRELVATVPQLSRDRSVTNTDISQRLIPANANASAVVGVQGGTEPEVINEFLEGYRERYRRVTGGALPIAWTHKDMAAAGEMLQTWPVARLLDMAELFMHRNDKDVAGKPKTIPFFKPMAPWADARLREAGR